MATKAPSVSFSPKNGKVGLVSRGQAKKLTPAVRRELLGLPTQRASVAEIQELARQVSSANDYRVAQLIAAILPATDFTIKNHGLSTIANLIKKGKKFAGCKDPKGQALAVETGETQTAGVNGDKRESRKSAKTAHDKAVSLIPRSGKAAVEITLPVQHFVSSANAFISRVIDTLRGGSVTAATATLGGGEALRLKVPVLYKAGTAVEIVSPFSQRAEELRALGLDVALKLTLGEVKSKKDALRRAPLVTSDGAQAIIKQLHRRVPKSGTCKLPSPRFNLVVRSEKKCLQPFALPTSGGAHHLIGALLGLKKLPADKADVDALPPQYYYKAVRTLAAVQKSARSAITGIVSAAVNLAVRSNGSVGDFLRVSEQDGKIKLDVDYGVPIDEVTKRRVPVKGRCAPKYAEPGYTSAGFLGLTKNRRGHCVSPSGGLSVSRSFGSPKSPWNSGRYVVAKTMRDDYIANALQHAPRTSGSLSRYLSPVGAAAAGKSKGLEEERIMSAARAAGVAGARAAAAARARFPAGAGAGAASGAMELSPSGGGRSRFHY